MAMATQVNGNLIIIGNDRYQENVIQIIQECKRIMSEDDLSKNNDPNLIALKIAEVDELFSHSPILRKNVKYEFHPQTVRVRGFQKEIDSFKKLYRKYKEKAKQNRYLSNNRFLDLGRPIDLGPPHLMPSPQHNCEMPAIYSTAPQTFTFPPTFLTSGTINQGRYNYVMIDDFSLFPNLCMIVFQILITLYDFAHDNIKDIKKACVPADTEYLNKLIVFLATNRKRKGGGGKSGDVDAVNHLKDTLSFVLLQIIDHITPDLVNQIRFSYFDKNINEIEKNNEIYLICFIIVTNKIFTKTTSYDTDEYLTNIYSIQDYNTMIKELGEMTVDTQNIKIIKLSIIQTLIDFFYSTELPFNKNIENIFNIFSGENFDTFFYIFVTKYLENYKLYTNITDTKEAIIPVAMKQLDDSELKDIDIVSDDKEAIIPVAMKQLDDSELKDIDIVSDDKEFTYKMPSLSRNPSWDPDYEKPDISSDAIAENIPNFQNPNIGGRKNRKYKKHIDTPDYMVSHKINQKGGDLAKIVDILKEKQSLLPLSTFLNSGIFRLYTCKLLQELHILMTDATGTDITVFSLTYFGNAILNWKDNDYNASNSPNPNFFNQGNTRNVPHPVLLILSNILKQLQPVWESDATKPDPFSKYESVEHSFESILFYLSRKIPEFEFPIPDLKNIAVNLQAIETEECCPYKFIVSNASTTLNQRGEHFQNFYTFYYNTAIPYYDENDTIKNFSDSNNSKIAGRNSLQITTLAGVMDPAGSFDLKFGNDQEFGDINCFVKGYNSLGNIDDNVSFNGKITLNDEINGFRMLVDNSINKIYNIDVVCNCEIDYQPFRTDVLEREFSKTNMLLLPVLVKDRISLDKIKPETPELKKTRTNMFETLILHLTDVDNLNKDDIFNFYYSNKSQLDNLLATTLNKTVGDLMQVLTVLIKFGGITRLHSFGDDVIPYLSDGNAIREINHHDLTASIITYFMLIFGGYNIRHSSGNFDLLFEEYENPGKNKGGYMSDHNVGRNAIGNYQQVTSTLKDFERIGIEARGSRGKVENPDEPCNMIRIPELVNTEQPKIQNELSDDELHSIKRDIEQQLVENFFSDPRLERDGTNIPEINDLRDLLNYFDRTMTKLKDLSIEKMVRTMKDKYLEILYKYPFIYLYASDVNVEHINFNATYTLNQQKVFARYEQIVDEAFTETRDELMKLEKLSEDTVKRTFSMSIMRILQTKYNDMHIAENRVLRNLFSLNYPLELYSKYEAAILAKLKTTEDKNQAVILTLAMHLQDPDTISKIGKCIENLLFEVGALNSIVFANGDMLDERKSFYKNETIVRELLEKYLKTSEYVRQAYIDAKDILLKCGISQRITMTISYLMIILRLEQQKNPEMDTEINMTPQQDSQEGSQQDNKNIRLDSVLPQNINLIEYEDQGLGQGQGQGQGQVQGQGQYPVQGQYPDQGLAQVQGPVQGQYEDQGLVQGQDQLPEQPIGRFQKFKNWLGWKGGRPSTRGRKQKVNRFTKGRNKKLIKGKGKRKGTRKTYRKKYKTRRR
jgi:hypothetical protein